MPDFTSAMVAIFLMGAVNYATRVGGYLIATQLRGNEKIRQILETLPGCAIAAVVMPPMLHGSPIDILALVVTLGLYWFTGRVLVASLAGLAILGLSGAIADPAAFGIAIS